MTKVLSACAITLALCAVPAAAEEVEKAAETAESTAQTVPSETEAPAVFADAKVVEERQLAAIAGREDVNQFTNADQNNAVKGNNVGDNSVTGQINISDQAFSNTNGFVVLNANTGNNVAINASIQVNVALPTE